MAQDVCPQQQPLTTEASAPEAAGTCNRVIAARSCDTQDLDGADEVSDGGGAHISKVAPSSLLCQMWIQAVVGLVTVRVRVTDEHTLTEP